jgi:AraC family transcriptional regulator
VNHRITTIQEKKLIGKRLVMSFSNNKTFELWRTFMPRRNEILNSIGADLYSVQIYPSLFFRNFSSNKEFEKWAAIEVTDFNKIPDDLECFVIPGGLYAVFLYKGALNASSQAFKFIFNSWMPESNFGLDNRPHFEILGEKYKNEDPNSEEEFWIPIKQKNNAST